MTIQYLWFGPNLFVRVKHRIESTIVRFLFDNENAQSECHLAVKILKNKPTIFIERNFSEGPNLDTLYWDVRKYTKVDGRFVGLRLDGTRNMTQEQKQDFKIKWQEALDQMINEDTFTFQIPTFLTEVLALENELFQIDFE